MQNLSELQQHLIQLSLENARKDLEEADWDSEILLEALQNEGGKHVGQHLFEWSLDRNCLETARGTVNTLDSMKSSCLLKKLNQLPEKMQRGIIDKLSDNHSLLNAKDEAGRTWLINAVLQSHWDTIQQLLKHGADPLQQDSTGKSAVIHAALSGDKRTLLLLMIKGLEIHSHPQLDDAIPLMSAIIAQIHHPSPLPDYEDKMSQLANLFVQDTPEKRQEWITEADKLYINCKLVHDSRCMVAEELEGMSRGMEDEIKVVMERREEWNKKLKSFDERGTMFEKEWEKVQFYMQSKVGPLLSLSDSFGGKSNQSIDSMCQDTRMELLEAIKRRTKELQKRQKSEIRMEDGVNKLNILVRHVLQWLKQDAEDWKVKTKRLEQELSLACQGQTTTLMRLIEESSIRSQDLGDELTILAQKVEKTIGEEQVSLQRKLDELKKEADAGKVTRQALRRKLRNIERIQETLHA